MNPPLRIAVYGPESTGKTELAGKLAAHFGAPLVAEYARERWDQQGALTLEDMLPVAREQWRREDETANTCNLIGYRCPLLICDTDVLTTMLWSDLLYGTCPDELRRASNYLNDRFGGRSLPEVRDLLLSELKRTRASMNASMIEAIEMAQQVFPETEPRPEFVVAGETNLMG